MRRKLIQPTPIDLQQTLSQKQQQNNFQQNMEINHQFHSNSLSHSNLHSPLLLSPEKISQNNQAFFPNSTPTSTGNIGQYLGIERQVSQDSYFPQNNSRNYMQNQPRNFNNQAQFEA